jgi:hypothetical protein
MFMCVAGCSGSIGDRDRDAATNLLPGDSTIVEPDGGIKDAAVPEDAAVRADAASGDITDCGDGVRTAPETTRMAATEAAGSKWATRASEETQWPGLHRIFVGRHGDLQRPGV